MSTHRSFLVLGSSVADLKNLLSGGLEIYKCNYMFRQAVDNKGKATTKVYGGAIDITLSQLPNKEITEWALNGRKYKNGAIILLDNENIPAYRIVFQNAACVDFELNYTQVGTTYTFTKLRLEAEKLIVGDGIEFENEWTFE